VTKVIEVSDPWCRIMGYIFSKTGENEGTYEFTGFNNTAEQIDSQKDIWVLQVRDVNTSQKSWALVETNPNVYNPKLFELRLFETKNAAIDYYHGK